MGSEVGCPLLWGGRAVKLLTPMGAAMLGTAAAEMPGGVLVPAQTHTDIHVNVQDVSVINTPNNKNES